MFALGHVSLGTIIGVFLGKAIGKKTNVALIFMISIMPDIDLLIPGLRHRGPTHSLILALVMFTPFLLFATRRSIPYFLVFLSHLVGDTIGGMQFFWPLSLKFFGVRTTILMGSPVMTYLELALFGGMLLTLWFSKKFKEMFIFSKNYFLVLIPVGVMSIPLIYKFHHIIPDILIMPYVFILIIFTLSICTSLTALHERNYGAYNPQRKYQLK